MSEPCIRCGERASRELRALQVRTLPIRSLAGEKRVQALGEEVTAHVCEACAAKQLKKFTRFVSKAGMDIDGISEMTLSRFIPICAEMSL